MGRYITFIVSKIEDKHEKVDGKYCFDVECYGDDNKMCEIREELCKDKKLFTRSLHEEFDHYKKMNPDYDEIKNNTPGREIYKRYQEVINECLKNKELWCLKCFSNINKNIFGSDSIDRFDINHSYSNKIWWSDWNIQNFYLGSETYYTRTLRDDNSNIYREITKEDIQDAYKKLDRLGDVGMLFYDIEAKEETIDVLEFLSKYADDNSVRMIIIDEI